MSNPDWENASPAPLAPARRRPAPSTMSLDRVPPHHLEAEQGVLGCVFLSPQECMGEFFETLRRWAGAEIFYDLRHREIFECFLDLHAHLQPIDTITVMSALKARGKLDDIGGMAYLASLPDTVPSAANMAEYIGIILDCHLRRQAIAIYTDAVARIYAGADDAQKLLLAIESRAAELTEGHGEQSSGELHIKQVMQYVMNDMEQWHYARGKAQLRGLPTLPPGNYLDKLLLGIRPTDYVVLAARPGEGKTSLAMNIVEYLAKDYVWYEPTGATVEQDGVTLALTSEVKGIPVCVFSIEMDKESLGYRLLFSVAGVDQGEWNQGFSDARAFGKLTAAAAKLAAAKIWIDDCSAVSINQLAAKARRIAKKYGIKLFVLDYLQLVESDEGNGMDRVKELNKISRKIMALKKQLQIPWIVLAQMNRNIETTEAKRLPVMSDLKDCGAIEQDADKIIFLYKPRLAETKDDDEIIDRISAGLQLKDHQKPRRINALVAKNRQGPTGIARLLFEKNLCKFIDWHTWKVLHGVEAKNAGETDRSLGMGGGDDDNRKPDTTGL